MSKGFTTEDQGAFRNPGAFSLAPVLDWDGVLLFALAKDGLGTIIFPCYLSH